jgi:pyruvyltransferase
LAIRLCWWDSKNFGDALNPYLFKALGHNVTYAQSDAAEIIAVGSYMERLLVGAVFDETRSRQPITVWGTGFQFEPDRHLWFTKIRQPEQFIRPVDIRALRGELSKLRAESITGQRLKGIALGDPGLLTSRIFNIRKAKKRYRLGIFCHFTDSDNHVFDKVALKVRDSIRIDVEAPVRDVVHQIASCEAIISSAMHPLIIADSLRVPNRWINVSANTISKYKFVDYYSAFDLKPNCFDLNQKVFDEDDLERLHAEYPVTTEKVEAIQDRLIEAMPLPGELRHLSYADILWLQAREAFVRDRLIEQIVRRIGGGLHRYKNAIQRIARRSPF